MAANANVSRKDHVRQQPSQPNAINIARYNKTMTGLCGCNLQQWFFMYHLITIAVVVISLGMTYQPYLIISEALSTTVSLL